MFRSRCPFGTQSFCRIILFLPLFFFLVFAEKKVSVSEVVFDTAVEDLQWLGRDHKTVLCRTSSGKLYRSIDSGRNWIDVSDVLKAATSTNQGVIVASIVVNPTDKDIVVIVGQKHDHFVSRDAGKTFGVLDHSGPLHNFLFHSQRSTWGLMSMWTGKCNTTGAGAAATDNGDEPCRHDLYVTKDLGSSHQLLANYVVQYSWGDAKHNQGDAVYFTHFMKTKSLLSQPRTGGWSQHVHFSRLENPGASVERVIDQGNKFLVSNGYVFVAKLLDPETQSVALMVSTDGALTFQQAKLSVPLQERSYTILDTSEQSVMLHVNHGHPTDDGIAVGNIYISDAAGLRYSLSLPKNVRTSSGECEFDRVAGLEGVYIGNFKAGESAQSLTDATDDDDLASLGASGTDQRRKQHQKGKAESNVKTVISFDKGGIWSYLQPPRVDSRGQKIDCSTSFDRPASSNTTNPHSYTDLSGPSRSLSNDCWLHLHGVTNFHRYAPFYSVASAVGVIMGTGNVGASLRYETDQVNTYLSRDGGLTWVETHKGAYIYEYGDHGGLVVMADDVKKTNQVVFSWNEGQSWYDFDLGDQQLNVDNIVIEPNASSVEFLMYGTRGTVGVLYHLDFATLGQPPCKGVWAADSVSSDYETWTPSDGRTGDNCILGRQLTYTRRKQTSECFNGMDFSRPVEKKNCTCTTRDYECEFGFTREIEGTTCIPEDPKLSQEGCQSSGIFYANAYRKVPGDTCVGGWVAPRVPVLCPDTSPFSSRAKFVLVSTVAVMAALAVLTVWSEDPRLQGILGHSGVDTLSTAKYAVIGGAARFLDSFDFHMGTDRNEDRLGDQLDGRSKRRFHAGDEEDEDIQFIESEQQGLEDIDAPPLLDFSSSAAQIPTSNGMTSRRGGLQTATESVPRLHPPPTASQHPVREFEML